MVDFAVNLKLALIFIPMSLLTDFRSSIAHYGEAIKLIKTYRLYSLLGLSFIYYLVLVVVSLGVLWIGTNHFMDSLHHWLDHSAWFMWLAQFKIILILLQFLLYLSLGMVMISLYKYFILALASPMYAYISEKTAECITGKQYPFDGRQLVKNLIRGIKLSFLNFFIQMGMTVLLIILAFIPFIGFISPFLMIALDSYYYGFAMLDYNCERDQMTTRQSRQWIKSRSGLALGNGFIFYLAFLIPVIGLVLFAPLSAVASTISYYQNKNHTS